jgi:uncharacterized RDD family membrane protein YckC
MSSPDDPFAPPGGGRGEGQPDYGRNPAWHGGPFGSPPLGHEGYVQPPGWDSGQQHPYQGEFGRPKPPPGAYAHWGLRVGSALIDGVAAGVIYFIGLAARSGALIIIGGLLGLAFTIWNLIRQGRTGQTIGKSAVGTKLVREVSGSYVGAGLSIGRYFLHIVDSLPCYLGYVWPLWDSKRQTFADKIAGTVVVRATK